MNVYIKPIAKFNVPKKDDKILYIGEFNKSYLNRTLVCEEYLSYYTYDGYRTTIWTYKFSNGDVETVKSRVKVK